MTTPATQGHSRAGRLLGLALGLWVVLAAVARAEGAGGDAGGPVASMIVLGAIMLATYVAIAFELLHKALAAMCGAVLAVIAAMGFGLFAEGGYETVHEIIGHDLGVLGVILGTSILVEIAGHSGLFHFISVKIVKRTQGEPKRLFLYMIVLTVLFCTLLTIAPGTLIMVTLALAVTKELKLDPKPYIMGIALAANSGALVTFASGICTMMVGAKAGLHYLDFFRVTTPIALLAAVVVWAVVRRLYREELLDRGDREERAKRVEAFDAWALVHDKRIFWRCAMILLATVAGFATAQAMGVGLDLIAMAGGAAALLLSGFDTETAIRRVKWPLIVFFVGLFTLIGCVQATGLLAKLAAGIEALSGGSPLATTMILGVFVLVLSGIVDNIPVAATLIPIVVAMGQNGMDVTPLWWTLVVCANLGGNSTPVGSVAAVIAVHALEKERNIRIGWGEYLKVGGLTLAIQGILALTYLWAFFEFDLFPEG